MSKIEECWVIQRGNDLYAMYIPSNDTFVFNTFIQLALFHSSKDEVIDSIETYHLQNCHPVKVELRVVGE